MSSRLWKLPPATALVGGQAKSNKRKTSTEASLTVMDIRTAPTNEAKNTPWTLGLEPCDQQKRANVIERLKTAPVPAEWIRDQEQRPSIRDLCTLAEKIEYWSRLPLSQRQDILDSSKSVGDFWFTIADVKFQVEQRALAAIQAEKDALENARVGPLLANGTYTHIVGPISLTEHYSKSLDLQVFIFGDWHRQTRECAHGDATADAKIRETSVPLLKLLDHLLTDDTSTKLTKDLFLEAEYLTDADSAPASPLAWVERHYDQCFRRNKQYCDVPSSVARFHYTDVRRIKATPIFALLAFSMSYPKGDYKQEYERIRQPLQTIQAHMTGEVQLQDLLKRLKITNQWQAIADDKVRKTVESTMTRDILTLARQIVAFTYLSKLTRLTQIYWADSQMKLADEWKLPTTTSGRYETSVRHVPSFVLKERKLADASERLNEQLDQQVADLHQLFMDAYLLGRLLRSFKGKTHQQKAYQTHRAIIIAGDAHSEYYRTMLERLGFESLRPRQVDTPNTSWQCIPLSKPLVWIK